MNDFSEVETCVEVRKLVAVFGTTTRTIVLAVSGIGVGRGGVSLLKTGGVLLSFLCHHCFQNSISPIRYFPKIRPWKFVQKINIYYKKECANHCRVAFLCPVCIPVFFVFFFFIQIYVKLFLLFFCLLLVWLFACTVSALKMYIFSYMCIPAVIIIQHGCQVESLWDETWEAEFWLSAELSVGQNWTHG